MKHPTKGLVVANFYVYITAVAGENGIDTNSDCFLPMFNLLALASR